MKSNEVLSAVKDMADSYVERLRPLIEQAVANGAIWGSLNMPVSDDVRRDVLRRAFEAPEFKMWGDDFIRGLAEQRWPYEMLSLQKITLANGKPWIENWDEKSAYEGFMAGATFACGMALTRIEQICGPCNKSELIREKGEPRRTDCCVGMDKR